MTKWIAGLSIAMALVACGTSEKASTAPASAEKRAEVYACPMHPNITSKAPGDCSECGMALVKQEHDHGSHDHGKHKTKHKGKKMKGKKH